jgi:hypothetical protein
MRLVFLAALPRQRCIAKKRPRTIDYALQLLFYVRSCLRPIRAYRRTCWVRRSAS